jgi:hypothetical protein
MSMRVSLGGRLLVFLGLSLLDLALTRWLIQPGSAELREVNPIARWCLSSGGWAGLASFKLVTVALALGLFVLIARFRPGTGARVVNVSCLAVGLVVAYSGYLLASNRTAVAEIHRQADKAEQLQREWRKDREEQAVLEALAADLAAGRCTLAEACRRWKGCQAEDPARLRCLRAVLHRDSDEECAALVLMRHAVFSVRNDPEAARGLADRLGDDFEREFGSPAVELRLQGSDPGELIPYLTPPRADATASAVGQ